MARRRHRPINLPAPYLKRVWLDPSLIPDREIYPFCLPIFRDPFDLSFESAITIIAGENGTGKSTILEGIAAIAGFDSGGGGKGHRSVEAGIEETGADLVIALRAGWVPKVTYGWFFRAETFFSVARYLDRSAVVAQQDLAATVGASPQFAPDYLSFSHGEGFIQFFQERCQKQGIFIFDEPESALSPARQIEFLKLLRRMDQSGHCQVIMATHAPMLMAYPNATLLRLSKYGLEPVDVEQTDHYRVLREFCTDPRGFVEAAIED
ncbi:AAA family ATPase [Bradyrhizobium sp. ORS 86]|uniref:AAA family ATPase n=1 Tax=Bradyrhizobium sp. ORS 86 TaxID=1685970 RepID=UPI00388E7A7F